MISAFASGDLSAYAKSIYEANLDAVQSQGCAALLTPAQQQGLLQAQQRFMEQHQQLHPGVGQIVIRHDLTTKKSAANE